MIEDNHLYYIWNFTTTLSSELFIYYGEGIFTLIQAGSKVPGKFLNLIYVITFLI